ncbi:hypothetical protein CEUSTIGMA_g4568.t1 [Chlamydomonas eustigma]|uniref:Uncharacterized protein n=1 Tax=Chlamydomonas eustigma TaxID=1157962 RepID=A0A250X2K5_9CHLO|nr:hypothetical protein CEUSTIGMA_g4568.t1 [Chlamydomonas eustigma]|eukprot:GAX77122.1 hypothetical protein CEUSTIGMA_g4568.t1 [Chlamydomonas eustigma]
MDLMLVIWILNEPYGLRFPAQGAASAVSTSSSSLRASHSGRMTATNHELTTMASSARAGSLNVSKDKSTFNNFLGGELLQVRGKCILSGGMLRNTAKGHVPAASARVWPRPSHSTASAATSSLTGSVEPNVASWMSEGVEEVIASHGDLVETYAVQSDALESSMGATLEAPVQKDDQDEDFMSIMKGTKGKAGVHKDASCVRPPAALLSERDDKGVRLGLPPVDPVWSIQWQADEMAWDFVWQALVPLLEPLVQSRLEARKIAREREEAETEARIRLEEEEAARQLMLKEMEQQKRLAAVEEVFTQVALSVEPEPLPLAAESSRLLGWSNSIGKRDSGKLWKGGVVAASGVGLGDIDFDPLGQGILTPQGYMDIPDSLQGVGRGGWIKCEQQGTTASAVATVHQAGGLAPQTTAVFTTRIGRGVSSSADGAPDSLLGVMNQATTITAAASAPPSGAGYALSAGGASRRPWQHRWVASGRGAGRGRVGEAPLRLKPIQDALKYKSEQQATHFPPISTALHLQSSGVHHGVASKPLLEPLTDAPQLLPSITKRSLEPLASSSSSVNMSQVSHFPSQTEAPGSSSLSPHSKAAPSWKQIPTLGNNQNSLSLVGTTLSSTHAVTAFLPHHISSAAQLLQPAATSHRQQLLLALGVIKAPTSSTAGASSMNTSSTPFQQHAAYQRSNMCKYDLSVEPTQDQE